MKLYVSILYEKHLLQHSCNGCFCVVTDPHFKALTLIMIPDGLLRPDISLQTLDAFHLGICCDHFCFPPIHLY